MLTYQTLESYRMAKLAADVPCYICGGPNTYETDLCRHCLAPMALAHQAASQKLRPRLAAVLGSAACGKTVYLGILSDILSQPNSPLPMLMRGAFSLSLQQNTVLALSAGKFPAKTPSEPERWNWIHSQVQVPKRRNIELIVPDIAGEALVEEIDHPRTFPILKPLLTQSSGALLLIDAHRLAARDPQQDLMALKIVNYLCDLDPSVRTGWLKRPLGIVLTKADQCDACWRDPSEFLRETSHSLWQICGQRLQNVRFFATSVAGACGWTYDRFGKVTSPLRIEPRGIVEPFSWLVQALPK
jgi:hypothetical protein